MMNSEVINNFEPTNIIDASPISNGFPLLAGATQSARTVASLKDIAFAKCGELTAFANYLYQSWITYTQNSALSQSLEQISMKKLSHLNELGRAIVAFGGKPNFSNSNGAYWSGKYVNQTSSARSFLESNICNTRCIIRKYREFQSQATNQSLISIIDRIIADELSHIQTFENLLSIL